MLAIYGCCNNLLCCGKALRCALNMNSHKLSFYYLKLYVYLYTCISREQKQTDTGYWPSLVMKGRKIISQNHFYVNLYLMFFAILCRVSFKVLSTLEDKLVIVEYEFISCCNFNNSMSEVIPPAINASISLFQVQHMIYVKV